MLMLSREIILLLMFQRVYDGETQIGYLGIDMSLVSLGEMIENIDKEINGEIAEVLVFTNYQENPNLAFYSKDTIPRILHEVFR